MTVSAKININQRTSLHFFTKIVALIILSWTCPYKNDENTFSKALENGGKVNISLYMRYNRLLAKHEYQNEMATTGLKYNASYNRDNYQLEKGKGNNNTFQQLKQGRSNNVDNYLKSYKNRYSKKKGLSKLDCYCEKKVLDKIHGLYGFREKLRNEKKSFKNFFLKKYGIGLILLALTPALGFIYSILFGVDGWWKGIFKLCPKADNSSGHTFAGCTDLHKEIWETPLTNIGYFNYIFTFFMLIVVLLFIFYTLIKVVKYDKLKSGKDKMSLKEYYRFTKSLL